MKLLIFLLVSIFSFSYSIAAVANDSSQVQQTTGLVKAGDKLITLLGEQVSVGVQAPEFKVVDEHFSPVSLSDFTGKMVLISVVPSLDTGVCSLQTKRFNDEVAKQPEDLVMLTISNDLPFAQKRFCKAENIDKVKVLSDSVWRDFGHNYGLLIKDMGLLTRAIFIIDKAGKIIYKELVSNISSHPDYESALLTIKGLTIQNETEEKPLPEQAKDALPTVTDKNSN